MTVKLPTKVYTVESSNVVSVTYDASRTMYVRFRDGSVYAYKGVPRQRVTACARAASVGKYLNRFIKPFYPYEKVA